MPKSKANSPVFVNNDSRLSLEHQYTVYLDLSQQNSMIQFLFVCLVWCLTSQSTAMVMSGWSVHLTTFFSWASLTKWFTSTLCSYFHL